jgi:hypothetical protein
MEGPESLTVLGIAGPSEAKEAANSMIQIFKMSKMLESENATI